jgi:WD40 repeat protein
VFLLGIGMGALTNLVTARPERWPAWSRPVVEWAWLIGAVVVVVVGLRGGWLWLRARRPRPEWTGGNPYPGLAAYELDRARVFFGRAEDARDLVRRVQGAAAPVRRFVPVVGPSGSGKSSLVLAGLLPALGDRWTVLPVITPGVSGVDELTQLLGHEVRPAAEAALAAARVGGPAPRLDEVSRAARGARRRVLLVVDQFEEAAVQHTEEERHLFLALLWALVVGDERLCVVATVRSEWVGRFQQGPGAELFVEPFMVNVLGPRQIREVVTEPARLTDTVFEEGLVETIVADTGRGDALPLLSSLLGELYSRLGRDRYVTAAAYERAGGVGGAIAGRAATAVEESGQDLDTVLGTLLLFVNLDGDEPSRRRVPAQGLSAGQREVVAAFVRAHLLTSDTDTGGQVTYEVAHEALLRQWSPLTVHIDAYRPVLRRITEVLPLALAWVDAGRSNAYLIPSERLADLDGPNDVVLPEPLAEFVAAAADHDGTERRRRASVAGSRALDLLDSDPATAISLSLAACTELAVTSTAATALYRSLAMGLRYVLTLDAAWVSSAVVAPDGRIAMAGAKKGATPNAEYMVGIWDEDGALLRVLTGHTERIWALAFAPDGRLASGDENGLVFLWDVDGRMIRKLEHGWQGVQHLTFAADGRLAATDRHGVCLWDATGEPVPRKSRKRREKAVEFAADGSLVIAGADGVVRIWDGDKLVHQLRRAKSDQPCSVTALAVAEDGRVAVGYDDGLVGVGTADGARFLSVRSQTDPVRQLAFSSSGHLTVAYQDEGWIHEPDGMETVHLQLEAGWQAMTYGPDDLLVLAVGDDVRLYGPDGTVEHVCAGHSAPVRVLAPGGNGMLVTADARGQARVWDLGAGIVRVLARGSGILYDVAAAPDGRLVSRSTASAVVRDLDGRVLFQTEGSGRVAFAPDGRLAVASSEKVTLWDAAGGLLRTLTGHRQLVQRIAFAVDGRLATAAHEQAVLVWDADGGLLHTLDGHDSLVCAVRFAPDGRFASGTMAGTVRIWGTDGRLLHVLDEHDDAVQEIAFAADGRMATGSQDCTACVWDRDGTLLHRLTGHDDRILHLAFTPDGRLATGADDGTVRVWDTDGALSHVLALPDGQVTALAVTEEGLILAGGEDGTTRVWDAAGQLLYELPGHNGTVGALALVPDGRLVTAGDDGKLLLWPAPRPLPDLVADARRCTLPPLTPDVRHRWMLPTSPSSE